MSGNEELARGAVLAYVRLERGMVSEGAFVVDALMFVVGFVARREKWKADYRALAEP